MRHAFANASFQTNPHQRGSFQVRCFYRYVLVVTNCAQLLNEPMMKLSDFILLTEEQKRLIVLHAGVLVGKRFNEDYYVFLFQLEGFYVEVFCNLSDKKVFEYRAYTEVGQLKPYLNSIDLQGLI
jgi:hypothetical protein